MADAAVPAVSHSEGDGSGHATAAQTSSKDSKATPPPAQFRPSPVRSFTVSNPYLSSAVKRGSSQPPDDRLPISSPASGRGSPGQTNGTTATTANDFGVIGGSRMSGSGRMGGPLPYGSGPVRASSFSVADKIDQRVSGPWSMKVSTASYFSFLTSQPSSLVRTLSSHVEELQISRSSSPSQFPTFSPSSSPSTSPTAGNQALPQHNSRAGQYSPPVAPANVSRSRSQSFATGVRPDRSYMMPLSTFDSAGASSFFEEGWRQDGSSNMSPFTSGMRPFLDNNDELPKPNKPTPTHSKTTSFGPKSFRTPQDPTFGSRTNWTSSPTTAALTTSVTNALGGVGGQPTYSSVVGGFEDTANGGRSGNSSRRHSMSVIAQPRRGFSFNDAGPGLSAVGGGRSRGLGSLGFTDEKALADTFGNALNLDVDENNKGVLTAEPEQAASSLPIFAPGLTDNPRQLARSNPTTDPFFGTSPSGTAGTEQREAAGRGRFKFADATSRTSFSGAVTGSPDRIREGGPGAIGAPLRSAGAQPQGPGGFDGRFGGAGGMGVPSPTASGFRPGPFSHGPPPGPGPTFGRPPGGFGYFGGIGQTPVRPSFGQNNFGGFGGSGFGGPPGGPVGGMSNPGPGFPLGSSGPPGSNYFGGPPQQPGGNAQSSPSFSSLSLADLGKGIPLASLPPTTPLYIVTFKAGRRDVFYCPDPTLLISNGDRVIVEADRGSDLGTVVYDQLTPVEVREWQERQATAALLSGASQHQPPGMAMANQPPTTPSTTTNHKRNGSQSQHFVPAPGAIDFTGADLNTLLSGVGPSGSQMDMGGSGGIGARGPLAKEIMPKRIFTKSSGGAEEQA